MQAWTAEFLLNQVVEEVVYENGSIIVLCCAVLVSVRYIIIVTRQRQASGFVALVGLDGWS
eukprot:scaffold16840_cov186-Skeletonema_marinoi.AAC.1